MAKKVPLRKGDFISATLGINMPLDDSGRGAPWVKAEVSATTQVKEGEAYENAVKRLNKDVKKRLDANINYLLAELRKSK